MATGRKPGSSCPALGHLAVHDQESSTSKGGAFWPYISPGGAGGICRRKLKHMKHMKAPEAKALWLNTAGNRPMKQHSSKNIDLLDTNASFKTFLLEEM